MNLAVKLPKDLKARLLAFPFLQTLVKRLKVQIEKNNQDPETEEETLQLHLLAEKEDLDALYLLPFQAFYHELEQEDMTTVFNAHRAVKNMKLDQVDVFVSLSESFVDASLGKSMGAIKRVGFSIGKNSLFLNQKVSLLKGRHVCDQYLEMFKPLLEKPPEEMPKAFSRNLEPYYSDWQENPYIAVNLSAKKDEVEGHWEEFFSLLEGVNIVLLCDQLPRESQKEILSSYVQKLGHKNNYKIFELESNIDFAKMASHAQTFISMDSALVHVAAYCGGHIHYMFQKEDIQKTGPIHFLGEVKYFNLNEPFYKEGGEVLYHKVFDDLYAFIDDKKEIKEEK